MAHTKREWQENRTFQTQPAVNEHAELLPGWLYETASSSPRQTSLRLRRDNSSAKNNRRCFSRFLFPFFSFSNLNEFRLRRGLDGDYGLRWVPSPPWQKKIFVLSSGCESRDLQTKPSWIYFQSERGTDDGEGGGGTLARRSCLVKRCTTASPEKKTHTKKKAKQ